MYLLRTHILAAMPEMRRRAAPCASQAGGVGVSGAVRLRAQIETLLGEFRIAGTVPEMGPAPGDARTACVADALRDTTYPAPPAQPGESFPMPLHLELPPAP
jgi:hypothetical protein